MSWWPALGDPDRRDPERLRSFIAIAIDPTLCQRIVDVQNELRSRLSPEAARWSSPAALHLTLHFAGDVARDRVAELADRLRAAVAPLAPVELTCGGLGCFPRRGAPRVIWAGIDGGDGLATLQRAVAGAAAPFGAAPAAFRAHVTLARIKRPSRVDLARLAGYLRENSNRTFGRWTCTETELLQSTLTPAGSRYTSLATLPLAAGAADKTGSPLEK